MATTRALLGIMCHLAFGCVLGLVVMFTTAHGQTTVSKGPVELSARQLYATVSRSLVVVEGHSPSRKMQGSGVVYRNGLSSAVPHRPNSSWIVSNAHVVRDSENVFVSQSVVRYAVKVEYADEDLDLALIHVPGAVFPPLPIDVNVPIQVGQRVYAIGSPVGLENSITEGLVSGLRKLAELSVIQTSAQISPGNSGGGLFDVHGRLLGITTFKAKGTEGVGFAVSVTHVREIDEAETWAGLVRVVLKVVLDPASYRLLDSPQFTKWVRTARTADGRRMYQEIERIDDENVQSSKLPMEVAMQKQTQAFLDIYDQFRAVAAPRAQTVADLLILICKLSARSGDRLDLTLRIDTKRNLVNGYRAAISDHRIAWSPGKDEKYRFEVDRYAGIMSIFSEGNRAVYSGKCERATERKF